MFPIALKPLASTPVLPKITVLLAVRAGRDPLLRQSRAASSKFAGSSSNRYPRV
jgi:hypothetical protein